MLPKDKAAMNKKQFEGLLAGVRQMGRHMRGKAVARARVTKVDSHL